MILAGAGGHALEVWDQLSDEQRLKVNFFDNISLNLPNTINGVKVLSNQTEVIHSLKTDSRFIVATGDPLVRKKLYLMLEELGGTPYTLIAPTAFISQSNVSINLGCNIMAFAFISSSVVIGCCSLINSRSNIHHHVTVGDFCEIGPGAMLLGNVGIGDNTMIGAGAVILPNVQVGSNCKIGAGAIVTKNVPSGVKLKGNPAK